MTIKNPIFGLLMVSILISPATFAADWLKGHLTVTWGDPRDGGKALQRIELTTDKGEVLELSFSEAFLQLNQGLLPFNGKRVAILKKNDLGDTIEAQAIRGLSQDEVISGKAAKITGPKPWVSILCKFADRTAEQRDLPYFQGMYGNVPGQLDHYWREVSYDNINVVGSMAFDWVALPSPWRTYVASAGDENPELNQLFNDCTAAADSFVNFSLNGGFEGINMMFNDSLGCCAWGGQRFTTLDGLSKGWRITWNPPWAFASESVIAHEMGHGFGLPHANNQDGDIYPYDNPWDVMSASESYVMTDATYGRLGKHINAYHKDRLDWLTPDEIFIPTLPSETITIDAMAVSSTPNYRVARINTSDPNRYYMVEVRKRMGNYDGNLAGDAVIIHEIVAGRPEPSWVVDADDPPATFSDNPGVMWVVGETFDQGEFTVTVDSETTNGFVITIGLVNSENMFQDGFETETL